MGLSANGGHPLAMAISYGQFDHGPLDYGAIILHRAPLGPLASQPLGSSATWWVSSWDVVHRAAAAGCHRSSSSAPGSKGDPPAGNWGVGLSIELLFY